MWTAHEQCNITFILLTSVDTECAVQKASVDVNISYY